MPVFIGYETDFTDILCCQSGHFENAKEDQNVLMQDLTPALCDPSAMLEATGRIDL